MVSMMKKLKKYLCDFANDTGFRKEYGISGNVGRALIYLGFCGFVCTYFKDYPLDYFYVMESTMNSCGHRLNMGHARSAFLESQEYFMYLNDLALELLMAAGGSHLYNSKRTSILEKKVEEISKTEPKSGLNE